jgi:hypothetical protein
MSIFNNLDIIAPPYNHQTEFNKLIHKVESLKIKNQTEFNIFLKLISSLQNQAFTTGFTA